MPTCKRIFLADKMRRRYSLWPCPLYHAMPVKHIINFIFLYVIYFFCFSIIFIFYEFYSQMLYEHIGWMPRVELKLVALSKLLDGLCCPSFILSLYGVFSWTKMRCVIQFINERILIYIISQTDWLIPSRIYINDFIMIWIDYMMTILKCKKEVRAVGFSTK